MYTQDEPPLDLAWTGFPYAFAKLDKIIKKDVLNFLQSNYPFSDLLFNDFKEIMDLEMECIKLNLSNAGLKFSEERLKRYVQWHQRSLIQLSGALLRYVDSPETLSKNLRSAELISYHIYKQLQQLMLFMERHHTKYVDHDAWLPHEYLLMSLYNTEGDVETILKKLGSYGICDSLINTTVKPLGVFSKNDTETEITYRDVIYLDELRRHLLSFRPFNSAETSLSYMLVHLNFNSEEFYQYWIINFEEIKSKAETPTECTERLRNLRKELSQTHVRRGFILDVSLPDIKDSLCQWLTNEIEHQERQLVPDDTNVDQETITGGMIKMDLSIAQIAYLVYVLVSLKVIQNDNISALLKFLSRIIKTSKKEAMSYDYLKGKFYKSESGARTAVLNLLQRMIGFIKADNGKK